MSEFLKEGYIIKLGDNFFKVIGSEPFNYKTNDSTTDEFTVISTAASSGFKDITNLEPSEVPMRLYQVRVGIQDGCAYYFKIPTGTNRWGVDEDKDVGYIDNIKSPYFEANDIYEFFLIHDYYPSVNASNAVGISVIPCVYFEGMKYDIERLSSNDAQRLRSEGKPYKEIILGGVKVSE